MRIGFVFAFATCILASAAFGQENSLAKPLGKSIRVAMLCFKTGERVSGLNRICYYDCLGSEAAITNWQC